MQHNVTMIKPPPDQYSFDREISGIISNGDITDLAGYLRKDRSTVSRTLSPDRPDCKSPFFGTIEYLWGLDAMGKGQAGQVVSIITRRRMLWLPAPYIKADAGKSTSKIGKELMDLMEKELDGASEDDLLKEAIDIKEACDAKIAEILSRRHN